MSLVPTGINDPPAVHITGMGYDVLMSLETEDDFYLADEILEKLRWKKQYGKEKADD